jgi:hypothetical protein
MCKIYNLGLFQNYKSKERSPASTNVLIKNGPEPFFLDMTLAAVSYAVKRREKQVVIWMIELFEYLGCPPS